MTSALPLRSVPDRQWQSLKEIIVDHASRHSVKELAQKMRDDHGFHATEAQYHRQFRKWRYRKNLTIEEWRGILPILSTLWDEDRHPRVTIYGRALTKAQVDRARRNCATHHNQDRQYGNDSHSDSSVPYLDQVDIHICRPNGNWSPLEAADGHSFDRLSQARARMIYTSEAAQGAWSLPLVEDSTTEIPMEYDLPLDIDPTFPPPAPFSQYETRDPNLPVETPLVPTTQNRSPLLNLGLNTATSSLQNEFNDSFEPQCPSGSFSVWDITASWSAQQQTPCSLSLLSGTYLPAESISSLPSIELISVLKAYWTRPQGCHQPIFDILSRLELVDSELQTIGRGSTSSIRDPFSRGHDSRFYGSLVLPGLESHLSNFIRQALVAIINNYGCTSNQDSEHPTTRPLLKLFQGQPRLLQSLRDILEAIPNHIAVDLAGKLITACISAGYEKVLGALIATGLIPTDHDFWHHTDRWQVSPFEIAVKSANPRTVKILIDTGAHQSLINSEVHRPFLIKGKAPYDLACVVDDWVDKIYEIKTSSGNPRENFTSTVMESMVSISKMLVTAGFRVPTRAVEKAVEARFDSLITFFSSTICATDHRALLKLMMKREQPMFMHHDSNNSLTRWRYLEWSLMQCTEERAIRVMSEMLSRCSAMHSSQCMKHYAEAIVQLLIEASSRQFTNVIRLFAAANLGRTRTWIPVLSFAIREELHEIVDLILRSVPEIHLSVEDTDCPFLGSLKPPLVEAILKKDHVLVTRLGGVKTPNTALVMLKAAAVSGDCASLRDILRRFPDLDPHEMSHAVTISILNERHEIFWELKKAGADIASTPPLHAAVFKKDKEKFFAVVNSGLGFDTLNLNSTLQYNFEKPSEYPSSSLIKDALVWGDVSVIKTLARFRAHEMVKESLKERADLSLITQLCERPEEEIRDLVQIQIIPSPFLDQCLAFAISSRNLDMARRFIGFGANLCSLDVLVEAIEHLNIFATLFQEIPRRGYIEREVESEVFFRATMLGQQGADAVDLFIKHALLNIESVITKSGFCLIGWKLGSTPQQQDLLESTFKNPMMVRVLLKEMSKKPMKWQWFCLKALKSAVSPEHKRGELVDLVLGAEVLDLMDSDATLTLITRLADPQILSGLLQRYPRCPASMPGFGVKALEEAIYLSDERADILDLLLSSQLVNISMHTNVADTKLSTPLGLAISRLDSDQEDPSRLSTVEKLLKYGYQPSHIVQNMDDSVTITPTTAFCFSIQKGSLRLVQLMLNHMTDVHKEINTEATLGLTRTPLQQAVEADSLDIVNLLLYRGADPNGKPSYRSGATAFQLAAIRGRCDIADTLLKHGADMHAPKAQIYGNRPLEGAALWGRVDMIHYLDKVGYRFEKGEYESAVRYAKKERHFGCASLLTEIMERKSSIQVEHEIEDARATERLFS